MGGDLRPHRVQDRLRLVGRIPGGALPAGWLTTVRRLAWGGVACLGTRSGAQVDNARGVNPAPASDCDRVTSAVVRHDRIDGLEHLRGSRVRCLVGPVWVWFAQ